MINNSKNKKEHVRFYCLLVFLLGLCFVRYGFQINFPRSILLIVVAIIVFGGDPDEIIAMMICCIPLDTSLHLSYALFICLGAFVLKCYKEIYINASIVPFLLMVLWELLHCFGKPFSLMTFGTNFVPFLVLCVLMLYKGNAIDYPFICRALSITTILTCIVLLGRLLYVSRFNILKAITNLWRLGADTVDAQKTLEVEGGHQNPNTLGILCVLAISGLLQLKRMGVEKKSDVVQILFLLVFGALTSSRTYLACLTIMASLFWFSQKGGANNKLKLLHHLIFYLGIVLIALYIFFPSVMEYYLHRLVTKDKYATRGELLTIYHHFILNNPKVMFWGIGLQNYYSELLEAYRVVNTVPHNALQEMIIAWGVLSVGLFILLGIAMVRQSHRFCKKQRLMNYIPILIILAKSMVGQLLDSPYTLLALSYGYLSMRQEMNLAKTDHI